MTHDQEYYNALNRLNSTIARLPPCKERVQFSLLIKGLQETYSKYNSLCVEARVRPTIKSKKIANDAFVEYKKVLNDIELSLTLAIIFIS